MGENISLWKDSAYNKGDSLRLLIEIDGKSWFFI